MQKKFTFIHAMFLVLFIHFLFFYFFKFQTLPDLEVLDVGGCFPKGMQKSFNSFMAECVLPKCIQESFFL